MWATSALTFAQSTLYLDVAGQPMALELTPRNIDRYGIQPADSSTRFYGVHLRDFPESKGRAAYIDGQWQGLLLHDGQLHLISALSPEGEAKSAAATNRFVAQTLNQDLSLGQCGFTPQVSAATQSPAASQTITPRNFTPRALQIDYDTYCDDTVEGVCLVGQLTLVFDSQFESDFGSSYQSQAIAITEYVDLLYQQEFKIAFNKLRMAFGSGDQFGGGNDIEAVLDDMEAQRVAGDTASFDPNVFSILHFISGRNYADAGPAIGIAFGPTYASFPTPDFPLLCSGYAMGTSQVFGSGSNRTALTSIIVAHEIGHNFGFLHDGVDPGVTSCSSSAFIMAAELNPSASGFSSCSHDALAPNLNAINNIETCFDFPINASLVVDSGNPAFAEPGSIVNTRYDITAIARSDRTLNLRLTGTITSSAATLISARLDSTPCTLNSGNTQYTCNITNASVHSLELELQTALSNLSIRHQVASTNGDDFDVDSADNQVVETISVDFDGAGNDSENLASLDNKGSGGALLWLSLNLMVLLVARRHCRARSPS
ncbi:M12 family metallo-peptidase [Ketobacter sp.]|uniref:M12 family metallo-peptidase n=1 Tax=Ketobacter sp. TaxID=2083498 RepID=UPI0025C1788C|nr:M12 family metallo-peptidase [Ketobacter sp.]